ncbi:MAG: DUF4886 domain-containing protein [Flavobacteriales bacterium]|nr:DUF4886 domain-containing protein [Flavobacteriales bacterium]
MRLALFVLLLAALPVRAQQTDVLFIGNSYTATNDLPNLFRQIALSLGDTVNTTMQAPGGYTLANHLFDPATQNAIASQQWDYVVLQEQSLRGALPTNETFSNIDATALNYAIQESSECAYPVFFMTWGYANGYTLTSWEYPELSTYAGMQQALRDNYTQFALENEGYVSPVGWAWKRIREMHPDIDLYQADESHPSVAGTYLAACVFYCTIFRQSCVGSSFTSTVDPTDAAILQAVASATVLDSVDTWNLNEIGTTDAEPTSQSSEVDGVITFHHFGQGQHWWTCSNGQSSTEAEPTFTAAWDGLYTYTHVYTDPCGHTDTYTGVFQVYTTGIAEPDQAQPTVSASGQGMVTVSGGNPGDRFEVFDPQGRLLLDQTLNAGTSLLSCPSGMGVWRITIATGARRNGKLLVP